MFLLAHTGITLGAAVLGSGVVQTLQDHRDVKSRRDAVSWVLDLSRFLDIRLLLIGSILPDIIDKPLGHLILHSTLNNGRIFSHTLLFALIILLPGLWLYLGRKRTWLLAVGIGVIAHLTMDQMWRSPQTLFWPLSGVQWASYPEVDIIQIWVNSLEHSAAVYVPEIIGTVILAGFITLLIARRQTLRFIRHGKL